MEVRMRGLFIYSNAEYCETGHRVRSAEEAEDDPLSPRPCAEVGAEQRLSALWGEAGQPIAAFSKAAWGAGRQHESPSW